MNTTQPTSPESPGSDQTAFITFTATTGGVIVVFTIIVAVACWSLAYYCGKRGFCWCRHGSSQPSVHPRSTNLDCELALSHAFSLRNMQCTLGEQENRHPQPTSTMTEEDGTSSSSVQSPINSRGMSPLTQAFLENDSGYTSGSSGKLENVNLPRLKVDHTALYRNMTMASLPFIEYLIGVLYGVDSSGGEYHDTEHDFTVRIPAGAIPEGLSLDIEVGITLTGPFQCPAGIRPVSPIIWLHVRNEQSFRFHKPVNVTLPHYIDISSSDPQSLQLCFLKASDVLDGNGQYCFQYEESEYTFDPQSCSGTLSTTHFCFGCIGANVTQDDTARCKFCLVTVEPMFNGVLSWDIHYCLCYCLKTCIEVSNTHSHIHTAHSPQNCTHQHMQAYHEAHMGSVASITDWLWVAVRGGFWGRIVGLHGEVEGVAGVSLQ